MVSPGLPSNLPEIDGYFRELPSPNDFQGNSVAKSAPLLKVFNF